MRKKVFKGSHPRSEATKGILSECDKMLYVGPKPSEHDGKCDQMASRHDKAGMSGRSMVEMLGVLAIMGVLSVGGLAGYGKVMHKYRVTGDGEPETGTPYLP